MRSTHIQFAGLYPRDAPTIIVNGYPTHLTASTVNENHLKFRGLSHVKVEVSKRRRLLVQSAEQALDLVAGEARFQIAIVKDALPDLPGSMVVRTIKQVSAETIVLLFTRPRRERPGQVQVVESARTIPFINSFTQPRQLADRLDEIRDAFRATTRERRYLGAFRQQHFELLKRYAELKQKLTRAKEGAKEQ